MILDPRLYRLDEVLRRPYTPQTPFGASGDCLWAASPQGWGFRNGVRWVHPTGDAAGLSPFTIRLFADEDEVHPGDAVYRPSHVTLNALHGDSGLQVTEDKFITDDDVLVSVLRLRNPGEFGVQIEIDLRFGLAQGEHRFRPTLPVHVFRHAPAGDDLRGMLASGGRQTLVFAVAFAPSADEARRRAARWARGADPVAEHAQAYQNWFDENVPLFDCSDPWLTKLWYHRWYLVKKNRGRPSGVSPRTDDASSAMLATVAGHALRETRWLRSPDLAQNYLRRLVRSFNVDTAEPQPDGGNKAEYPDGLSAAVWDLCLVHSDGAFLQEVLPTLEANALHVADAAPNLIHHLDRASFHYADLRASGPDEPIARPRGAGHGVSCRSRQDQGSGVANSVGPRNRLLLRDRPNPTLDQNSRRLLSVLRWLARWGARPPLLAAPDRPGHVLDPVPGCHGCAAKRASCLFYLAARQQSGHHRPGPVTARKRRRIAPDGQPPRAL
jgi:hypothetical protein